MGGILFAALGISLAALFNRPDRLFFDSFLYGDQSLNLVVADQLNSGKLLYRDIFYQYGPIPAYFHASIASVFGNSMISYIGLHLVLSLVMVGLLSFALLRVVSRKTTAFVMVMGVFPTFLTPGSLMGAYATSAYIPLERLCLILLMFWWLPPLERSFRRAFALGIVLGTWQLVKFGGAFFAGLALVSLDLLLVRTEPSVKWRPWLANLSITAAGFVAVEGLYALLAFALLPYPVALDALWPQYMLVQYKSLGAQSPLPVWAGWKYFVGQQMSPCVGIILAIGALCLLVRFAVGWRRPSASRLTRPAGDFRLLLPFLFWLFGFAGYFRHVHLPLQHVWTGSFAGALLLSRFPRMWTCLVYLLWLPGLLLILKANLIDSAPPGLVRFPLRGGEKIYVSTQEDATTRALVTTLQQLDRDQPDTAGEVAIVPMGAGIHHFYTIPFAGRHVWYLSGFVRPYEEDEFVASLKNVRAVVLRMERPIQESNRGPGWDFNQCFAEPIFSDKICEALNSRLGDRIKLSDYCWVYPVR